MTHNVSKKERNKKNKAYEQMVVYPDGRAAARFHQQPFYLMATDNNETVFEEIIKSPESLADFIYHNQLRFHSVSEVVQFLNRRSIRKWKGEKDT